MAKPSLHSVLAGLAALRGASKLSPLSSQGADLDGGCHAAQVAAEVVALNHIGTDPAIRREGRVGAVGPPGGLQVMSNQLSAPGNGKLVTGMHFA